MQLCIALTLSVFRAYQLRTTLKNPCRIQFDDIFEKETADKIRQEYGEHIFLAWENSKEVPQAILQRLNKSAGNYYVVVIDTNEPLLHAKDENQCVIYAIGEIKKQEVAYVTEYSNKDDLANYAEYEPSPRPQITFVL